MLAYSLMEVPIQKKIGSNLKENFWRILNCRKRVKERKYKMNKHWRISRKITLNSTWKKGVIRHFHLWVEKRIMLIKMKIWSIIKTRFLNRKTWRLVGISISFMALQSYGFQMMIFNLSHRDMKIKFKAFIKNLLSTIAKTIKIKK